MAKEWLPSDVPALIRLAILADNFLEDPRPNLAAEIRLQEQRFGLSPLDRWRLQWEVRRVLPQQPDEKPQRPRTVAKDPRGILRVVKGGASS